MNANIVRTFVLTGALAALCASSGCVADRPSRNGVFNENQYLRKDFLVRPGDGSAPDPGWMMKTTVSLRDFCVCCQFFLLTCGIQSLLI